MKKLFSPTLILFLALMISCNSGYEKSGLSIPFEKYTLPNGLTVVLNVDKSDPITAIAIYYHVGSSREEPGKTGFAHLFEHMMFQRSENVGEDQLFREIQAAGGTLNGSTSQDRTNYYEVVPKNALELVLWLESDRMGYLANTVTKASLANQQNVVQNEKRQSVDNAAYGFNQEIIAKNLYPEGHPYSWTVIGLMEDLTGATVEDVKAFHGKYYVPNNATLSISGDIEKNEVKKLIEKYFGEIPAGAPVEKRKPMPVSLASTKKLFHEDNFARAPQLTMVFPTAERYSKDSYALSFLGEILSNSKKAALYTVLVKDKKLTSRVMARNIAGELAGSFMISVAANPGVNLNDVEKAIFESFEKFEKEGFSEDDLTRIKAQYETRFYNSFESVLGKSFQLAEYTMYTGDPGYFRNDIEAVRAVTMDDITDVYNRYIKGRHFVQTGFVPKGELHLIAEGSVNAGIVEEDVTRAAEIINVDTEEEPIIKTPASFDRSVKPVPGPDPAVSIPQIWKSSLSNGLEILGIEHNELPLVEHTIIMDGGHITEELHKAGLSNLVASMMNEGTRNRTPEELEDAIGLLGASIRFSSAAENISVNVSTLKRNFEKTTALVEEMLLEPRWDEEQFGLAKNRIINSIERNRANPSYLASSTLNKLIFGEDNIMAVEASGTEESVSSITVNDLKDYYNKYFSPSTARLLVTGNVSQKEVESAFERLGRKWMPKDIELPHITIPAPPEKSAVYFIDVPGAKQSVINIGTPSLPRTSPDFYSAFVANYKLGGSFNGVFNLILREEKGFTYGARSHFSGYRNFGIFSASSMVRTNSTLESVIIFKTEMEKYRENIPQEYVDFTKSALLKNNALSFETNRSLLSMLNNIASYGLPVDYIRQEEAFLTELTKEKLLELAKKFIDPSEMYYVVAGDAKTQLRELEKAGLGKPVLLK